MTSDHDETQGVSRRKILECMTWAGTGVLWTIAGGVPRSTGLIGEANAAALDGLTFLQISDSHVGFDKPANPEHHRHARGSDRQDQGAAREAGFRPSHRRHHASLQAVRVRRCRPHHLAGSPRRALRPGRARRHRSPTQKVYRDRYGRGTRGAGWYSFDDNGVHFIGLVNVVDLKAGGLGNLGDDQLEWLEDDLKGRSASTPIVVFAHIPLWSVYPQWGWGTDDAARRST